MAAEITILNLDAGSLADLKATGYTVVSVQGKTYKVSLKELADAKTIAPEFSATASYAMGSLVMKDGQLYRSKELLSAGSWDSTKWESVDVDGAIPNVNHSIKKADGTQTGYQTNYVFAIEDESNGTVTAMFSKDAASLTADEVSFYAIGASAIKAANAGKVLAVNADGTDVELITPTSGDIPTKTSDLTNDSGFITADDVPTKTSQLENDGMGAGKFVVSTAVVGIQVVDELPAVTADGVLYLIRE